jgi:solute carrier family 8 (sodium/calcium exchanger)
VNKVVGEEFKVGIRTRDGTAVESKDYTAVDEIIEFGPSDQDKYIEVGIVNDDIWEENEDFYVELYDPDNNEKLPGNDTETKVTVIDDDQPGILGFERRQIMVNPKEGVAGIKVHRLQGADGEVTVSFETTSPEGLS